MCATKHKSWVRHLAKILVLIFMSDLAISQDDGTTRTRTETGSTVTTSLTSVMERIHKSAIYSSKGAFELTGTTAQFVTSFELHTSLETVGTDATTVSSSSRTSSLLEANGEMTTFSTIPTQEHQQLDGMTTSLGSVESAPMVTDFIEATDGDLTKGPLDAESFWTSETTSVGHNLTTLMMSKTDVTSPMSAASMVWTSSSPSLSHTSQETATTLHQKPTVNRPSPKFVPDSAKVNITVTVIMSLEGNCKDILQNKRDFLESFKNQLVKDFNYIGSEDVAMVDAKCGSIVVDMSLLLPLQSRETFLGDMESNFSIIYKGVTLQVYRVSLEGKPTEPTESTTPFNDDETTGPDNFQQTLIFIVIGSVGGAFVLLSFFLLCQYLTQKIIKASKKSYRPSDEPCIKLADFNMAHTYIPRPQSIYSATTRSSFLPYESMDQGYQFPSASPTPYVYADGDQIREHYQEVVEKDPVTPTTKTINDFGRSSIPSWDLPVLEGVVHQGANGSTLRIDDRNATTSSTFQAPADDIPPPPTTPPPPPPSVEYHQSAQRAVEGSLKSDDDSSHTEQSMGDTRHLIKGQEHRSVGIDNPAADIDNAYF